MNLLIVDDEYYTVESISNKIRTLRPDFFEIFCAYNLTQALEAFSAHPIDLMICDIEMPGGSGLELLDQIRQAHYETVCIFLTAYAKFEYISRAMKLSSSDYLLKRWTTMLFWKLLTKPVRNVKSSRRTTSTPFMPITGRKVSSRLRNSFSSTC